MARAKRAITWKGSMARLRALFYPDDYSLGKRRLRLERQSADARYAERFELYICGLEIANCFGELTDGEAQLKRFEHEQGERVRLGKSAMPIDKELINALKCLPNAAGVALGMDRMIMLFTGARNINEVIFQTVKDQLEY